MAKVGGGCGPGRSTGQRLTGYDEGIRYHRQCARVEKLLPLLRGGVIAISSRYCSGVRVAATARPPAAGVSVGGEGRETTAQGAEGTGQVAPFQAGRGRSLLDTSRSALAIRIMAVHAFTRCASPSRVVAPHLHMMESMKCPDSDDGVVFFLLSILSMHPPGFGSFLSQISHVPAL
jgi:hypothetical protein